MSVLLPYRSHDGSDSGIVYFLAQHRQYFSLCIGNLACKKDIVLRNIYPLGQQILPVPEADSYALLVVFFNGLEELLFALFSHWLVMLCGDAEWKASGGAIGMKYDNQSRAVIVEHLFSSAALLDETGP